MSFATRNLYRTAIEELARSSPRSELEVAKIAARAADQSASTEPLNPQRSDPGYYLIGAGRKLFEAEIGFRPPVRAWAQRIYRALGLGGYATSILLVAAVVLIVPLLALSAMGLGPVWLSVLAILGGIPALDASVALVNAWFTRSLPATLLPSLELRDGVPKELRTLVAVPVILTSLGNIEDQIENLEIHYLAGLDDNVHFALLSDWPDADSETQGGEEPFFVAAAEGIARLNSKYAAMASGDRFLLLQRRRVWNETERRWIGWERKRGKLHELNRLLRGAVDTTFITIDGRPPLTPTGIQYVITLDADTKLPRETVRRLVGKIAHPLNQPRFDPTKGRVVEGHGIIQPRISAALPVENKGTLFQRIFSGATGIDPYTAAVSDVYQDLFGEGSYAGKGIYHLDTFEASLAGRVPDSTLLSHDLFEGVFARAGLASDIEVVEDYPERYDIAMRRHHRWARGDWQLLPWILGVQRGSGSVPAVGRAKMVDNLRRSLTAPCCLLALLTGWAAAPDAALLWTGFIVLLLGFPAFLPLVDTVLSQPPGTTTRSRWSAATDDVQLALARWLLQIVQLAGQAWMMGDAIVRTLVRLTVTRRKLLQWTTAAELASGPEPGVSDYFRRMAGGVVIGLASVAFTWYYNPATLPLALAFGVLWISSPGVAYYISRPPQLLPRQMINRQEGQALRRIARQTWRYFETFVGPEDNMLPPDNFQEDPVPVVAHRTSPTNIGMYLLSVVSARDFGWIGTFDAVERMETTLSTLRQLDRYRGHFYNWYDTRDLRVLEPAYISSVDSGNLAGNLIVAAAACRGWSEAPANSDSCLAGFGDALGLAREAAEALRGPGDRTPNTLRTVLAALDALSDRVDATPAGALLDDKNLASLAEAAERIVDDASARSIEAGDNAGDELYFWANAAWATVVSHRRDIGQVEFAALVERLGTLASAMLEMALDMEFNFLLDEDRKLLSIGYLAHEGKLDSNCYDLLASEARLASFLAIAKGDVPARHWFRLGHAVTPLAGGPALISWSGSMFEYLMPTLIMRSPVGSLLERSEYRIVKRQIEYGRQQDLPWGISESGFNARDLELTYQYSNFGVPGLGLKRGLGQNKVIAPYATGLAAMIDPKAALKNFARLVGAGGRGRYGFYEALDFTPNRHPAGEACSVVRSFMAHHQGMTVVAIANAVLNEIMRARFHQEPLVKAAELLLQERMPRQIAVAFPLIAEEGKAAGRVKEMEPPAGRRYDRPDSETPATHMLCNGRYSLMLTAAGSGQARWRDLSVTRWRSDTTCDDWGSYIYLRDVESGEVWSASYQPTRKEPDSYAVLFNEDRAEYSRRDGDLTTTMNVVVSAEDDSEARRIAISNSGRTSRVIEITSYVELSLATQLADVAHPAFSKLFVETERLASSGALLAWRRKRGPDDVDVVAAHMMVVEGKTVGNLEF
ncbi:MAG: DUF3131 domain-containing protein, partial [Sphingomonas sp.]|nr:DUF3131 domain-containing protein [Sphingomonas sp.]